MEVPIPMRKLLLFSLMITATTIACRYESELEPNQSDDDVATKPTKPPVVLQPTKPTKPTPITPTSRSVCDTYDTFDESLYVCYVDQGSTYFTGCHDGTCLEVPVHVTYMLSEDLGPDHTVIVEAFDNHMFQGHPISTVRMTGFDATTPGVRASDVLLLAPGDYYVRAYLATNETPITPYQYGDMELVSDRPFGLYGALSSVTKISVGNEIPFPGVVTVFLDKLFRSPESLPPTDAHIRTIVHLSDGLVAPLGQKVWIELYEHEDFSFHPKYSFAIPTDSLRIAGQMGRAEFYSDHLDLGDYFVLIYMDTSGNGFYDRGEPWQVYKRYGEYGRVHIEADKTVTIELTLTNDVDLEF